MRQLIWTLTGFPKVATTFERFDAMFLSDDKPAYSPLVHYFQFAEPSSAGSLRLSPDAVVPDDELADAAESIREAEIEAVRAESDAPTTDRAVPRGGQVTISELSTSDMLRSLKLSQSDLESMTMDEVRTVASALDIPDRGTIVDKSALIEEIVRRL